MSFEHLLPFGEYGTGIIIASITTGFVQMGKFRSCIGRMEPERLKLTDVEIIE